MSRNLINTKKAAEMLGAHPHTVRKWAEAGEIPAIKAGRVWRFDPEMLRTWARVKQTGHAPASIREAFLEWLHGSLDDSIIGPPPYVEILKHCTDIVPVESVDIINGGKQGDTYADLIRLIFEPPQSKNGSGSNEPYDVMKSALENIAKAETIDEARQLASNALSRVIIEDFPFL